MNTEYYLVDIYECIKYDSNKEFQEQEWVVDRQIGSMNLGYRVSNIELVRTDAMMIKVEDNIFYSEEYQQFYAIKPTKLHERYVKNIRTLKIDDLLVPQKIYLKEYKNE